ncbi:MAG TPA: type II toxin-antitoxin system VapC family toxin [Gemmata sp.]
MTHSSDTDTLSIWQTGTGTDHSMLALRMSGYPLADVGISVVSFHEQMVGANAYLSRGRTSAEAVTGYAFLERLRQWFAPLSVVPFDEPAALVFDQLKAAKVRIGTMDLRIAAIARSRNLTVVTRNVRDFGQVPNLRVEDWTH